jgi:DNA (cytosine-5)-methyltransferase 1
MIPLHMQWLFIGENMKTFVTVSSAAQTLNVSIDTIRRWEKKGLIKASRDEKNYRVFDLDELRRAHEKYVNGNNGASRYSILTKKNMSKYRSIELFAGAGGLALGLENAGFQHELLVEIDKMAAATLKKNRPEWNVSCADAREISFAGMSADIVTGGFPCQAFSFAGSQLGFEDARGTLFFEMARCIKEVQPKIAVGENVKGLLAHDNGKTLKTMLSILDELGYRVAHRVLRAQYLDVPQKRERLVIIAVRKDLDFPIYFPREKDYTVSMREALQNVPDSLGQQYPARKREILDLVPPGGYWRDLPLELQKEYMAGSFHLGGGKTGMARRLSWDEPSLTLTCSPAQKQTERCHPEETRPLNVREYARIQTFPDDWIFEGSTAAQYKQIGNAVPVNLGFHIGACLMAMLDGTPDFSIMEEVLSNINTLPVQAKLF